MHATQRNATQRNATQRNATQLTRLSFYTHFQVLSLSAVFPASFRNPSSSFPLFFMTMFTSVPRSYRINSIG